MVKKQSGRHTARAIVRLSLPLICTVALGGPSLMPIYAEENPPAPTFDGDDTGSGTTDGGSSSVNGGGTTTDGGGSTTNQSENGSGATKDDNSDTEKTSNTTGTEQTATTAFFATTYQADNSLGTTQQAQTVSYDYDAGLYRDTLDPSNQKQYAGVYATGPLEENAPTPTDGQTTGVVELKDEDAETIGMPSIADANLPDAPTTESPAIIVGSAVGYETRTVNSDGSISYSFVDGVTERDTVYDEFKRSEVSEQKPGQDTAHKKITGYDGTYVIVRLDVSKYFEGEDDSEKPTYLHVKQKDNNTLLTATGWVQVDDGLQVSGPMQEDGVTPRTDGNTYTASLQAPVGTVEKRTDGQKDEFPGEEFEWYVDTSDPKNKTESKLTWKDPDAKSNTIIRTGSYTKAQLTDETDGKQYLDVLVFATASNVAGADKGKEGQLSGDVPISMYTDNISDYRPDYGKGDEKTTDPLYNANCLGKFFDATRAVTKAANAVIKVSKYIVKGSDLALETMVEKSDENNEETTYWSLAKSFEKPYYDQDIDRNPNDSGSGRTVSLMSEVAVTDELSLTGNGANDVRKRTLDVNSFDVQVASNTGQQDTGGSGQDAAKKVGFNLKNAWLTIADFSNTTGSEFAIGNNSTCTVDEGGRLIIDETCQLEIEWDGATKTSKEGETTAPDILDNGFLNLMKGGTVVNNGVITIEGTEGKPYAPETKETAISGEKGCGVFLVEEGATLINNGCMIVNGRLYNLGTIENNGRFDDTIVSTDPDKGTYKYHKGIQVSWKDDIRQPNVIPGGITNGRRPDSNQYVESATIINRGDILLVPGVLVNYGKLDNGRFGRILECPVTEAYIPVEIQPTDPKDKNPMELWTIEKVYEEKRKDEKTDPTSIPAKTIEESYIFNHGTLVNRGFIGTGTVTLGLALTDVYFDQLSIPGKHEDVFYLESIGDSASITNYGFIPGIPTEPEPLPAPRTAPRLAPRPYIPRTTVAQGSSSSSGTGSTSSPAFTATLTTAPVQKPAEPKGTIHRVTADNSANKPADNKPAAQESLANAVQATIAQVSVGDVDVEIRVVADPKIEQIADGVYEIVEMPEIEVETITDDGDHSTENLEEAWWCVEIDGEKVRVMNTHGKLAPGIAHVIWADNADLAQATLVGIDLGDGQVIVIGPDTELFLDFVWS